MKKQVPYVRRSDSPKFVERRTCFKCGEFGHIIKNCTNTPKEKFVERAPPEKVHPQRRPVSPKHDKRTVKEQETKQRRQNVKAVEKALKSEVKFVNREPSSSQSSKPEISKSFYKNQTGIQKKLGNLNRVKV